MTVNVIKIVTNPREGVDVTIDDIAILVGPSMEIWNHANAFNVGYGGSGPAQLALAILMYFASDRVASKLHQRFKWDHVSKWQPDTTVELDIESWITETVEDLKADGRFHL